MKKFSLIIALIITAITPIFAQDNSDLIDGKDEVKINAFNLIAFKYLDGSYERLIDEESSIGIGLLISLGDDYDTFDVLRDFSLTPYYRRYFSKGYAKGFFVEGFGMLNSSSSGNYIGYNEVTGEDIYDETSYTDFALGVSIGGKFLSKKGFVAEVYGGVGRNLFNTNNTVDVVGRGGVSLGFRF